MTLGGVKEKLSFVIFSKGMFLKCITTQYLSAEIFRLPILI
jgi:hypothetical protein